MGYLEDQFKSGIIPEADFVILVWNGLTSALDMGAAPVQLNEAAAKEVAVRLSPCFI